MNTNGFCVFKNVPGRIGSIIYHRQGEKVLYANLILLKCNLGAEV